MTLPLYLRDDPADASRFVPFSQSRPLGELRYGAYLLRERWKTVTGLDVAGHLSAAHLAGYTEPGAPPVVASVQGPCVVVRSTLVPVPETGFGGPGPARLVDAAGAEVGAVVPAGTTYAGDASAAWPARPIAGKRLEGIWQIIGDLPSVLRADLLAIAADRPGEVPRGATVLGDPALVVAPRAIIEPHAVFDVRSGPIVLADDVEVRTFTRLQGPLWAGSGTRLVGGQLRESSIGPRCVVHGELSNSVLLGYANKSHDGFVGHTLAGRWVNLGAGTITSNLKNTYGPVRLNLGAERIETGMTFLGSLLGDHVKTAIGTMLPTGCVVGTGANIFGSRRPDSVVPAFAWGTDDPGRVLACRMFLQTAARVLPRRDIAMDEATRTWLSDVWRQATGQSCD